MEKTALEVNFDGIVGPTHNYSGLAYGNIASMRSKQSVSNPREALLQGLAKMRLLMGLGLKQAVLPPQERPDLGMLRRLGYSGNEGEILAAAAKDNPALLAACSGASAMWAANAATVSPSPDTRDGRVHFTPANLVMQLHRSIEASFTGRVLRRVFDDPTVFAHHDPLPGSLGLSDEGAANHNRFCRSYGGPGVELFVYGRSAFDHRDSLPRAFPARQSQEASAAVARIHGLDPERTVFVRQSPRAIDAGVFHNDVISVGDRNVFLFHEEAFADSGKALAELGRKFEALAGEELFLVEIASRRVSLEQAVSSYLFNSQLVTLPDGASCLIAPTECRETDAIRGALEEIVAGPNPIETVHYIDVRQSMKNGGGPACLRLRVALTEAEMARAHVGAFMTEDLYERLRDWGERNYRDRLLPRDLFDPSFVDETRRGLDELTQVLGLGAIYEFQTA